MAGMEGERQTPSWLDRGMSGLVDEYQRLRQEDRVPLHMLSELVLRAYFLSSGNIHNLPQNEEGFYEFANQMRQEEEDLQVVSWKALFQGTESKDKDKEVKKSLSALNQLAGETINQDPLLQIACLDDPDCWLGWRSNRLGVEFSSKIREAIEHIIKSGGVNIALERFLLGRMDEWFLKSSPQARSADIEGLSFTDESNLKKVRASLERRFAISAVEQALSLAEASRKKASLLLESQFGDKAVQAEEIIKVLAFSRTKNVPETGFKPYVTAKPAWEELAGKNLSRANRELQGIVRRHPANFSLETAVNLRIVSGQKDYGRLIDESIHRYNEQAKREQQALLKRGKQERSKGKRQDETECLLGFVEGLTGSRNPADLLNHCLHWKGILPHERWTIVMDIFWNEEEPKNSKVLTIGKVVYDNRRKTTVRTTVTSLPLRVHSFKHLADFGDWQILPVDQIPAELLKRMQNIQSKAGSLTARYQSDLNRVGFKIVGEKGWIVYNTVEDNYIPLITLWSAEN